MPISPTSVSSAQVSCEMLNASEAAAILGVSRRYLDKDRYLSRQNGTPPTIPYVSLGHRTVRYHRSDVMAFLLARRVE